MLIECKDKNLYKMVSALNNAAIVSRIGMMIKITVLNFRKDNF